MWPKLPPNSRVKVVPKRINLALQGGGAHGAYTWGVLDRLLEDPRVEIEGVSGTSAGAMNAAVLVNGYVDNGRDGARLALDNFWKAISEAAKYSVFRNNPLRKWLTANPWNLDDSPAFLITQLMSRLVSPYFTNPLNYNPLRQVLEQHLDIQKVNGCSLIKIFVTATRVRDGKPRVFQCSDVSVDALLASACLPQLFQGVEIDGELYWDGGFVGNPALWPLIYNCRSSEIVLVQINPVERQERPITALEITNRVNEITFNSSLIAELRVIDFVSRLIDQGHLDAAQYKRMHIHLIARPTEMSALNASSKLNTDWDFLQYLKQLGRHAANQWLTGHFNELGRQSSCDIDQTFLQKTHSVVASSA